MEVKVGLAQINPRLGNVPANLELHLNQIDKAVEQGVELLIFPELSLTGYRLRDLTYEVCMRPTENDPIFNTLLDASRHLDLSPHQQDGTEQPAARSSPALPVQRGPHRGLDDRRPLLPLGLRLHAPVPVAGYTHPIHRVRLDAVDPQGRAT